MLRENEEEYQIKLKRGFKVRHTHVLRYHQWTYYKELAEQGKFEQLKPKFQLVYDEVNKERTRNVTVYKQLDFNVFNSNYIGREKWIVIPLI